MEALLAPFQDRAVAGTRGGYTTRQRSLVARFVQLEMDEKQERLATSDRVTLLDTACAAYRRSVFLGYGGFDDRLPATSVEDAEFSFRLAEGGERLVYAPGALVCHHHPEEIGRYLWRKLRFGYFRAQLYGRYPRRLSDDGYTPRLMPVQIALSGALVAALVGSVPLEGLRPVLAALALVFVAATLPLATRASRTDPGLAPLVPALLMARSTAQGFGLLAGLALRPRSWPGLAGQLLRVPSRLLHLSPGQTRWLGGLLSLAALAGLALLLAGSDRQALLAPLAGASVQRLVVALLLALAVEVAKSVRWQLLLGMPFASLPALVALVFTSRLLNALAPLRAGDLWRFASASRGEGRPILLVGGSMVAEKLLDGVALATVAALLLSSTFGKPPSAAIMLVLPAAAAALMALLLGRTELHERLPHWARSLSPLYSPRVLVASAALTMLGLGLGLAVNLAVLAALGLGPTVALGAAMLVGGYAAGLIPSGPGQAGVFELAVAAPLTAMGLDPAAAVAAGLTLHVVMLAMLGVGGIASVAIGVAGRRMAVVSGESATREMDQD